MSLPTLMYVNISSNPSPLVQKVLDQESTLVAGGSYLALGFVGMQDAIVIVDSEGVVVTLPYDEDSFSFD